MKKNKIITIGVMLLILTLAIAPNCFAKKEITDDNDIPFIFSCFFGLIEIFDSPNWDHINIINVGNISVIWWIHTNVSFRSGGWFLSPIPGHYAIDSMLLTNHISNGLIICKGHSPSKINSYFFSYIWCSFFLIKLNRNIKP